jgi:hypothetical protein
MNASQSGGAQQSNQQLIQQLKPSSTIYYIISRGTGKQDKKTNLDKVIIAKASILSN